MSAPNAMIVRCGRCQKLMPFREIDDGMAVFACRTCDNIVQIMVGTSG